jgi:ferredoxin
MKVRVDRAACVGNARCHAVDPELYPLDDDGYVDSEGFAVAPNREKRARDGARACPERIILVEEDDGTIGWPPQA